MGGIKEGTLYKSVEIEGVLFDIYYGYECEGERAHGWDPSPLYPDFAKNPLHTKNGKPFALIYDEPCDEYLPISKTTECICCANCKLFEKREEIIGVCNAEKRRKNIRY